MLDSVLQQLYLQVFLHELLALTLLQVAILCVVDEGDIVLLGLFSVHFIGT